MTSGNTSPPAITSPLAAVLQHLRREPSRTWSIVITVFGDVVLPRGGSFWLGSLLDIFAAMDIGGGVVRTAMSRLASDGWLERRRVGRNSFYSLTARGRSEFETAAVRIYGRATQNWDGRYQLLIPDGGADEALAAAGFGSIAGVWLAPSPAAPQVGFLALEATTDVATGRALAARAWALDGVGLAYARFLDAFRPLLAWGAHSPLEALVTRVLLIHEYRRVVLRDPLLPLALLPPDWPGEAARLLCADLYRRLAPASEAWLDEFGRCEAGSLPLPSIEVAGRFDR